MTPDMPMLIWTDTPDFVPPGDARVFLDGQPVSLLVDVGPWADKRGWARGDVRYVLTLAAAGAPLARHEFAQGEHARLSPWLVADPRASDPDPSWSAVFAAALAALPAGDHALEIALTGERGGEVARVGGAVLTFRSTGSSPGYAALAELHGDAGAARGAAIDATVAAEDAAREERRDADRAAREFTLHLRNEHPSRSVRVNLQDTRTLSDDTRLVEPGRTVSVALGRGQTYAVSWYDQDERREDARPLGTWDSASHDQVIPVAGARR